MPGVIQKKAINMPFNVHQITSLIADGEINGIRRRSHVHVMREMAFNSDQVLINQKFTIMGAVDCPS